ncbi:alpha/beta hydrolase [Halomarina oriensis]|uniref:Alpha/beta fold hydrolase n=1 Tax=Halomarina oriensis TaxID=671145 RepID=A0A6B0GG93_9EURY|nr:alpha/beta fold hydrolase [Halomarina oriensis]MWG33037.1 alpha/beta fold hydrolase [Halomarina oriensis]
MDLRARRFDARDGLRLNCWEHAPDRATEAVVFVHGSITCSRALFSPPVERDGRIDESYSWLAATAETGRAAFGLDVRGYGDSERPPELNEPPEANGPPVRADLAANDIADTVAHVREEYDTVHLVGVSWGTNTCGRFVARDDPEVASLTQVAPVYRVPYDVSEGLAALGLDPAGEFGAYHRQEYETVKERQGETDEALFEAIWRTQVESNQGEGDGYIAQTGSLADYADCGADDPPYDAADIAVPTLVVRGSADAISWREDALALYDELPREDGTYLELAGADHYAMHGERRADLYDAVSGFHDRV